MRWLVLVVALAVGAPSIADAQPGNAATQPTPLQAKRERIKKRLRALRAYTLTEELQLDEATAGKLFPLLARYDDEFDKLLGARAEIQKRLTVASNGKDARATDHVVDEAIANQRGFWDIEDKRIAELRKILTPAQTARLLVVLPAWERKIENQLRNAIQGKGPGAGGGPGNGGVRQGTGGVDRDRDADEDEDPPTPRTPPRGQPRAPRGD